MKKKIKAILITGASRRLGFAIAKKSIDLGYAVVAHYHTSTDQLGRWCKANPVFSDRIFFIKADLRNNPGAIIDTLNDFPIRLVGLVNNASLFSPGSIDDYEHLTQILQVNVNAPMLLAKRFRETATGNGWIINITDANVEGFNKTYQNYRFSKILLTELTLQQAFLFGPSIRVNALAPGAILPSNKNDRSYFDSLRERVPLRKNGSIASIVEAYEYLVKNNSTTGQILYLDNGLHLNSR